MVTTGYSTAELKPAGIDSQIDVLYNLFIHRGGR